MYEILKAFIVYTMICLISMNFVPNKIQIIGLIIWSATALFVILLFVKNERKDFRCM